LSFVANAEIVIHLAMLLMIFSICIIAIAQSINGRELIFGGVLQIVKLQSEPDTRNTEIVVLQSTRGASSGFKHFIYNRDGCPSTIADWLLKDYNNRRLDII
jgi:hypothetical protein